MSRGLVRRPTEQPVFCERRADLLDTRTHLFGRLRYLAGWHTLKTVWIRLPEMSWVSPALPADDEGQRLVLAAGDRLNCANHIRLADEADHLTDFDVVTVHEF